MQIKRTIAHAPHTLQLAQTLEQLQGPCIGCTDCQGVCRALMDALSLPDVIVKDRAA